MHAEITEDEIDIIHTIAHVIPDTDANSGVRITNVGVEAFDAVISGVTTSTSHTNGAEWQG